MVESLEKRIWTFGISHVIGARDLCPDNDSTNLARSVWTGRKLELKYVILGIYSITEVMIDVCVFPKKKLRNISLEQI